MSRPLPLTIAALTVTLAFFVPAASAVSVDGIVTASDGYGIPTSYDFKVENVSDLVAGGSLWLARDNGDLCVAFSLPVSLVNNHYGKNDGKKTYGWDMNHKFDHLLKSDKAKFVFSSPDTGADFFGVTLDYLDENSEGKKKSKVVISYDADQSSKDFAIDIGDEGGVPEASTSLVHNWQTFGSDFPELFGKDSASPLPDDVYVDPDTGAVLDWHYEVTYEFKIAGGVFAGLDLDDLIKTPSDFLRIEEVHASPNTQGGDVLSDFTPVEPSSAQPAVPEPLTVLGLLVGLGGMTGYIRKRRLT